MLTVIDRSSLRRRFVAQFGAALALALVVSGSIAHASEGGAVEWNPKWRKVGLIEGLSLIPMGAALVAIQFAWKPPEHPKWTGGIFFDAKVRNAFVGETRRTQADAEKIGDALFMYGSIAPLLIDVGVALVVHGKPDVALQMFLIDLQSAAVAGLVSLTAEHSVGRGRPFVGDCGPDGRVRDSEGRLLLNHCGGGYEAKSFYSGHSAATMTTAGLTCLHHQRMPLYGGGFADVAPCALLVGMSLTTGITRLVADLHWASDVVIGWGVGAFAGYILPAALHYGFSNERDANAAVQVLPIARASANYIEVGVVGAY
jgi:membrane-associated phospholipid phosphatase